MKKVYVAEKRGLRFYVRKKDEKGNVIPIYNEEGHRTKEYESYVCDFTQYEHKKVEGELRYKSVFIVYENEPGHENTPKEVVEHVEAMRKSGNCELMDDHIKRTNPDQHHALEKVREATERAEKAEAASAKDKSTIEQLEARLAALENKNRNNNQGQHNR